MANIPKKSKNLCFGCDRELNLLAGHTVLDESLTEFEQKGLYH